MKQNTVSARLVAEIRARIRSGALRPGERIPSARQLVQEHGIALATAARVLDRLKRERLVRVVAGVGTVVRGSTEGPELSAARIVEAAIAIADDVGLGELSMRTVATEVGVPTMSLYRHVASRDELVIAMIDAVMGERKPPVKVTVPKGTARWRARLEALARLHWEGYQAHPWLAQALSMTRPQLTPKGMIHTEWLLEVLEELPIAPEARLRTCLALIALVRGMALNIEPELEAQRDTGQNPDEWMASREAEFMKLAPSFPRLLQATSLAADMSLATLFERGLECFLDGLEAQARHSASRSS